MTARPLYLKVLHDSSLNEKPRFTLSERRDQSWWVGKEIGPEKLADMMPSLAVQGCHTINLVTHTHVVPQLLVALIIATEQGLRIPLAHDSGGYENAAVHRRCKKIQLLRECNKASSNAC